MPLDPDAISSILANKGFLVQMPFIPGTMAFTLGAPSDVHGLAAAELVGGAGTFAIGGAATTTIGGYVAAVEAGFAAGAPVAGVTTQVDANDVSNLVLLKDAATDDIMETAAGEEIFGLLHAANGVADGAAMAFGGAVNAEISIIYFPIATPAVPTNYTLPAGTYYFAPRYNTTIVNFPYLALPGGTSMLDESTEVHVIPTFTGINAAAFEDGSLVIALDTGYSRTVFGSAWGFDRRVSAPVAAAQTVYVRTTGNDVTGDGTVANPFLTIERAVKAIPLDTDAQLWTIDVRENATFTLPDSVYAPTANGILIDGLNIANWLLIDSETVTAVTWDSMTGAVGTANQNGRRVTVALNPWVAGALRGAYIEMTGGHLNGSAGYVYDNGTNWIQFDLNSENFGGALGLNIGDTFDLYEPATKLDTSANSRYYDGNVSFSNADMDLSGGITHFRHGNQQITNCKVDAGAAPIIIAEESDFGLIDSYLESTHASGLVTFDSSIFTMSSLNALGVIRGNVSHETGSRVTFGGRNVITNCTWTTPEGLTIRPEDEAGMATGQWLRLYDLAANGLLFSATGPGHAPTDLHFPYTTGNVAGYLIYIQTFNRHVDIRFSYGEDMVTGLPVAGLGRCTIDSGAKPSYIDPAREIMVLGTGNAERVIYVLEGWVGNTNAPAVPAGGLQGVLATLDFPGVGGLDSEAVDHFIVPDIFMPGFPLQVEFLYSTPNTGALQAAMEVYGYLFQPGIDLDIPAPANQYPAPAPAPGGAIATPISVPATQIEGSPRFQITDNIGRINAIALTAGVAVAVSIRRDLDNTQGIADNSGAAIRVLAAVNIYQTGL